MSETKPKPPIPDEILEKSISLLEGPVNGIAEKLLSSTIVLAPLSLSMNASLRALALLKGAQKSDRRNA